MPTFRFVAIDKEGATLSGRMEAGDISAVAAALRARGQWATEIAEDRSSAASALASLTVKPTSQRAFALIARELATLMRSGAPLDRALSTVADIAETSVLRQRLAEVERRVRGGAALADAFEAVDSSLPAGHIGLLRAGEASGALPVALMQLAETLERAAETREAIRGALIYPALVTSVAIGAVIFMCVVVLPRFQAIFAGAGKALPPQAAVVMAVSDGLRAWGPTALLLLVAAILAGIVWRRTPSGALALSRLRLATPLIGSLTQALDTARFCRTFAMLRHGGAPTLQAAGSSVAAMSSLAMRAQADGIVARLGSGVSLSEAMRRSGAFARIALNLAKVGEESGALEPMLSHAADLLESKARRTAKQAVDVIVPATTLLIGLLVAAIVVSVMSALLSINELA